MVVVDRKSPRGFGSPGPLYRREYERVVELTDGNSVLIRPMTPCDFEKIIDLFKTFSVETLFFRYLNISTEFKKRELRRLLNSLNKGMLILVAELLHGNKPLIGICELFIQKENKHCAECAITITDKWQGKHLGIQLLKWLIHIARKRDIETIIGYFNTENMKVLSILRRSGFKYTTTRDLNTIAFKLFLTETDYR